MEHTTPRAYTVIFLVVAAAGVGYVCFRVLTPFLAAIAWAIVLAVAFQRPWRWLEQRLATRRSLAAALLTVAVAALVLLPSGVFIGVLAGQTVDLANRVSARLSDLHVSSFADLVALPRVAGVLDGARHLVGMSKPEFERLAAGFATKASAAAAKLSAKLVLGAFDAVLTFVLVIFLLFFLFRDGRAMAAAVFEMLPTDEATRARVSRSLEGMLAAIFRGSLLCAVIQGVSGAVGWWVAGLPSPALAGAAMGVLSLLPVGGTAIVWLPGAIYLWSAGRVGWAVFLFAWGLVVTSFLADNVLRPALIRGAEELSMLVVFLGVFGGIAAFGLLGVFIGPLALALAVTLIAVIRQAAAARSPATP